MGPYHHIASSLRLQYVGDSHILSLLSWGMWALVGNSFSSKMAVIVPTRTSGYITVHGSGNKCSQVFVESVLLLYKSIHRLMLGMDWLFVLLLRQDNLSKWRWYNLWNVTTKVVLEINCGDSNSPVLAENLPFLENISGLPFSLKFSWFLKFSLAKKIYCFLCLTSFFYHDSLPLLVVFLWFLSHF